MSNFANQRARMVGGQIAARGVCDPRVLHAMGLVPREHFVPAAQAEFAYQDNPLAIGSGQTISQPYIVALMAEAIELKADDKVLEIGTGSGYGAAVLGALCGQVFTVERHFDLARVAAERLEETGFRNVTVIHGDGTLGLPAHAPFDAIVVTAGGPRVPEALMEQLGVGGRLVIPVGSDRGTQNLLRVRRISEREYRQEDLGPVRFVPLIGAQGFDPSADAAAGAPAPATAVSSAARAAATATTLVRECAEKLGRIDDPAVGALLDRIGDARVVLLGEASHGTSEFYRFRAHVTRRLIEEKGFRIVAVEADWPDAAAVNRYVQAQVNGHSLPGEAFRRFPTWMWRNREVADFVEWLRTRNMDRPSEQRAGFFGLDLYSLFTSIRAVLDYLERVDPDAARVARLRYGCLTPWEGDPAIYGRAAVTGTFRGCEREAVAMLKELMGRRLEYMQHDGARFFDAVANARLVADAERYYRVMYYGHVDSWNLRDRHMFETLQALLAGHGTDAKAVVWAHNSHLGDAAATEMSARGETNVGQLARRAFGDACYAIGFGTDHGDVAAASEWDGPMEVKRVRAAISGSYEAICHDTGLPAFLLPLRYARRPELRQELLTPRLERAIGVIYRPDTELQSHYFQAVLPEQFDEYVWFDETHAVEPLPKSATGGLPSHHPFAEL